MKNDKEYLDRYDSHEWITKTFVDAMDRHYNFNRPQRVLLCGAEENLEFWDYCSKLANFENVPVWCWNTRDIFNSKMVDTFLDTLVQSANDGSYSGKPGIIYVSDTELMADMPEVAERLAATIQGSTIDCGNGKKINTKDLMFVFGSTKSLHEVRELIPESLQGQVTRMAEVRRLIHNTKD